MHLKVRVTQSVTVKLVTSNATVNAARTMQKAPKASFLRRVMGLEKPYVPFPSFAHLPAAMSFLTILILTRKPIPATQYPTGIRMARMSLVFSIYAGLPGSKCLKARPMI